MRGIFGLLGLLLVVVIVGLLMRKQFDATPSPQATGTGLNPPTQNPTQQGPQIQEQFRKDLERALQPARGPTDP